jgi:subtilisin family serine protease
VTGPTPSPGPRRASIVSPLVSGDPDRRPARAAEVVHTDGQGRQAVLIELRMAAGADPDAIRADLQSLFDDVFGAADPPPQPVPVARHYLRCALTSEEIQRLVAAGPTPKAPSAPRAVDLIYHVWPDFVVRAHLDRSLTTIKADAAGRTFSCSGADVVWGVIDSGIDESHPHFAGSDTLSSDAVARLHRDFTSPCAPGTAPSPLTDAFGHGTHVAGIIAGRAPTNPDLIRIATNEPTAQDLPQWAQRTLRAGMTLSGVAPNANLVSLKVLDDDGQTLSSAVLEAIDYVRRVNGDGRDMQIHGVNLSLGCGWPPSEYAAGQSPLCRELDQLVSTGVVAVVSAGNSGAAGTITGVSSDVSGQLSTITDPGNAATAITVGSVHRYRPHTFGVTFDSSKGPTLDGRLKPDLVAPGERITSAATGKLANGVPPLTGGPTGVARYIEDSGTSMAAAHVSGVVAAFLSARAEYVGQPQLVKQLLIDTASDLGRHQFFQGAGLVDLMRALSST